MVLFLLLFLLGYISELQPCNIDVCLTWSATKEKISFKCKVNALLFTVKFFNQLHQEQAYCASPIPHVLCFPLLSNSNITQDVVHNITILTLERRIDDRINGAWTCCHGTNVDKAVVNVTVLRRAFSTGKHNDCSWENNTAWTFFGVLLALVVLHIVRCMYDVKGTNQQDGIPSNHCFKSFKLLVFKRVMFCILIFGLILLPLVVNVGKDDCSGQYGFIAFGFMMGFSVTYLFLTEPGIKCCQLVNKETNPNTSTVHLTEPLNAATQQENIIIV